MSNGKLEEARKQFLNRSAARKALFDALEIRYPELARARVKFAFLLKNSQARTYLDDCDYCQQGLGRHSHAFSYRDGALTGSADDSRLYGRESAVAYLAGVRQIADARKRATEASKTVVAPLSARAIAAYPELARYGFWPNATLAETDSAFAVDWQQAKLMTSFASAVKPVIESVAQAIRRASDFDMSLAYEDRDIPLAESPREAAELYGIAA